MDFWVVKNVSGRLLVRLRWWNEINPETKQSEWRFEYDADRNTVNKVDEKFFWNSMYLSCIFWSLISILNLITLKIKWLLLTIPMMLLNLTNLIAYWKCHQKFSQQPSSILSRWISNSLIQNTMDKLKSFTSGFNVTSQV
jgi:hypothetical protein